MDWIGSPWPWYVAGPLIGLIVPALLVVGNKPFGISSSFRHICAAALPCGIDFFSYDWKAAGLWNLTFLAGVLVGGFIGGTLLAVPMVAISSRTAADLTALGIRDLSGLVPRELFSWPALVTLRGAAAVIGGGFLVGFGTAYAGGCTSGHAITGLADLQAPSLVAVCAFFAGGLLTSYLILPQLF